MIDPEARLDLLREARRRPTGRGRSSWTSFSGTAPTPTPPACWRPRAQAVMADGGPQVVAYVLGTDRIRRASPPSGTGSGRRGASSPRPRHGHRSSPPSRPASSPWRVGDYDAVDRQSTDPGWLWSATRPNRAAASSTRCPSPRRWTGPACRCGSSRSATRTGASSGRYGRRTRSSPAPAHRRRWRSGSSPSIDALEAGLAAIADEVDVFHTQDCISARAGRSRPRRGCRRHGGADRPPHRRLHHRRPDRLPTTRPSSSRITWWWSARTGEPGCRSEYGLSATVIHNGVDAGRFAADRPRPPGRGASEARAGRTVSPSSRSAASSRARAVSSLFRAHGDRSQQLRPRACAGGRRRSLVPGLQRLPRRGVRQPARTRPRARTRRHPGRDRERRRAARVLPQPRTRWPSRR